MLQAVDRLDDMPDPSANCCRIPANRRHMRIGTEALEVRYRRLMSTDGVSDVLLFQPAAVT
nr:hypothetical protein JVH1_1620 [Rhodococcus sp. JVH1]